MVEHKPMLLGELASSLKIAIAIAMPHSRKLVEYNQHFAQRCLDNNPDIDTDSPTLNALFPDLQQPLLDRVVNSQQEYCFKQVFKKHKNSFPVDFVFSYIHLGNNPYILIQGTDNKQSLEMQSVISNYDALYKQQTQALTEEKEKSQAADHSKALFLSRMSHELRTQLNVVMGFAQKQQPKLSEDTELGSNNQRIISACDHLLELIIKMLDFIELEEHQLDIQLAPCDLHQCLSVGIEAYSDLQQSQNVAIHYQPTDVMVKADEGRLIQVIKKLICNGMKFNHNNGSVNITVKTVDKMHIEVAFEDTGIGVDAADQPRLFEPFFRTAQAEEQCIHGIGIGLAISKKIVERMGGRIHFVANKHNDNAEGMTFYLRLQVA